MAADGHRARRRLPLAQSELREPPMLSPEDRVVMVSGANRGIGLAVARCLRAKGYRLSLGARDAGKIDAALGDVDKSRIVTAAFDARDRSSCEAWVERTGSHFGR